MANIESYLNTIREAVFGKDVRSSIADGIDLINKEVESTTGKQELLETTFNELVINEGNSNAEIVQARVDAGGTVYENLKARMDNSDASLGEIAKKISYKEKQTEALSLFYNKLRNRQNVVLDCQGDSEFYGYDIYSNDKRPPSTSLTDNGVAHVQTRASKTMPEALQERLDTIYGPGVITVKNSGYSGDWVTKGMEHWNSNHNADVTILGYGINDSRHINCPYRGDVVQFIKYYRKLIEQKLDFGSAVILMTPVKGKPNTTTERLVDIFSEAVRHLGKEYGIPVVDAQDIMFGRSSNHWSDDTHLNGKGYTALGTVLASIFIGDGVMNPFKIIEDSSILPIWQNSSFQYSGNVGGAQNSGYPTPDFSSEGEGYALMLVDNTAEIIFSFYTEQDDMIVIPSIYSSEMDKNVTVELDFGIEQSQHIIDYVKSDQDRTYVTEPSSITINMGQLGNNRVYWQNDIRSGKVPYIHITHKGWHTIRIRNTMSSGYVVVHGLYLKNYNDVFEATGMYTGHTHFNNADTTTVTESRINFTQLIKQLGIFNMGSNYYYYPLLNIEVNNVGRSHDMYEFQFNRDSGGSFVFFGMVSRRIFSTANSRIISNISYDSATDEIVITWGGETNRAASFHITLAGQGGNLQVYTPSTVTPPAVKGGIYFDGYNNKFKKCIDGSTWIDM